MTETTYSIEQAAEHLGVTARTLHYYEEIGLIDDVSRTEGGHRMYDASTVERLSHILKLKHVLGCSLQEIRSILAAERELEVIREAYRKDTSHESKEEKLDRAAALLEKQIKLIQEKMERLTEMKAGFEERLQKVERARSRTE